jgi:hypothetical protein
MKNRGPRTQKNSIENPYEFNLIGIFNSLFNASEAPRKHLYPNSKILGNPHGSSESSRILMGLIISEKIADGQ